MLCDKSITVHILITDKNQPKGWIGGYVFCYFPFLKNAIMKSHQLHLLTIPHPSKILATKSPTLNSL